MKSTSSDPSSDKRSDDDEDDDDDDDDIEEKVKGQLQACPASLIRRRCHMV